MAQVVECLTLFGWQVGRRIVLCLRKQAVYLALGDGLVARLPLAEDAVTQPADKCRVGKPVVGHRMEDGVEADEVGDFAWPAV